MVLLFETQPKQPHIALKGGIKEHAHLSVCETVLSLWPSLPGCCGLIDHHHIPHCHRKKKKKKRDIVKIGLQASGDMIRFAFRKMTPAHWHGQWRMIRRLESGRLVWRLKAWWRSERRAASAKTRTRRRRKYMKGLSETESVDGWQVWWWKNSGKSKYLGQMTGNIMMQERPRATTPRKLTWERATNQERQSCLRNCKVFWSFFLNTPADDLEISCVTDNRPQALEHARK